ncbi:MAG: ribosome small subunit-dependent GTPase A [Clostridia bacterium]|nr:ribosome small subunit-dependent GTPase A [Clostridia bacterium]
MIFEKYGKVVKGLGGLYETRVSDADGVSRIVSRAKGNLKRDEERVLVGDNVKLVIDDSTPDGVVIAEVRERKNSLIRPPLANLDYLFIVFASAKPAPVIETVDKLIAIAEHNSIVPVVVITKSDISGEYANEYAEIYRLVGIDTFITSSEDRSGVAELSEYIRSNVRDGKTAAFAGASGVGKSTLMNTLFPSLTLATAEISQKIERGRHTTRHVEIFDIENGENTGFLADTPGFSLIDFARFDFFSLEELLPAFRDINAYVGKCRYADCAHVGEGASECAVARAAEEGKIAPSRLASYRAIYKVLKEKNSY